MHFNIVSIEIFDFVILSRDEQHKLHMSYLQFISFDKKEHDLYKLEKKYMIFDNPDIDMQHKAVMIVFKEYINERRKSIQLNDGKVKFPELSFEPTYGHYYRLVNQINSIRNKAIDFGRSKKRKKSKSYIL